jgi:hypothetical protein
MLRPVLVLIALAVPLAAAAEPRLREFRDWSIGCDNRRDCLAIGFSGQGGGGEGGLGVARAADPDAAPQLWIAFARFDDGDVVDGAVVEISTDAGPIGTATIGRDLVARDDDRRNFAIRDEALQRAILEAVRRASRLRFAVRGGDRSTDISLDGASASLLFMDDVQRRVGTVTALVRRGDRPASAVPAAPTLPRPPETTRDPRWRPVPSAVPNPVRQRALQSDDSCDVDREERPEVTALGRLTADLVLVQAFCLRGAYNYSYRYLLWNDRTGRLTPVAFPVPEGVENAEAGILTNPDFDATSLSISQFAKGRGLGDCGTASEWRWDGRAFRIVRYQTMPRCQGLMADDWFTLHRSE